MKRKNPQTSYESASEGFDVAVEGGLEPPRGG